MDDHPNIDNNEDDEQQQEAQAEEQEHIDAAAAIAAAAETKQRHLKIDLVLERKEKFPFRNRNKIDGLIQEFLEKLGNDIHDMLFENEFAGADTYDGLDSDRDTEEEVETAIRFFPEVLSRRKPFSEGRLYYPIQALTLVHDVHNDDGNWQCNVKTVLFIPIVARLAIEFDLFEEDKRGGLLCLDRDGYNVLQHLMLTVETIVENLEEKYRVIDDKYLQVLIQLRKLGLLKKEDIQRYDLLHYLCRVDYFAEKRLRFLVEWDPNALTQTDIFGQRVNAPTIQGFQFVFEYGIRYFPNKKGISLLFHKPNSLLTTFRYACGKFDYNDVMNVIEDTLARYSSTPINSADAVLSAAIDETVHLDGVYFLLRREPDMLQKLLSSSPSASTSTSTAVADCDININSNINNDTTDEVNSRKEKDRKCKRHID
ncbi:hypothetical protein FRACYDRAFT_245680 [Fragilariopsis cylindrus CCMP1102]|uniref:Uncharacterized protein n=1 Tax=Fragilariopsis cylindrus CCMP1102 TaxID=635003 RepID=A0A1E7EZB9_9STRA|nr:hypothetical protein FRACYDRAFT_245680 [Fragilariopsis cylindrus CCMP1102]|eukprot:OEU11348.1 hypothetical protein FRACYDRAFT_245680 [Fragilariopsis cylindrus CCMP1102]